MSKGTHYLLVVRITPNGTVDALLCGLDQFYIPDRYHTHNLVTERTQDANCVWWGVGTGQTKQLVSYLCSLCNG